MIDDNPGLFQLRILQQLGSSSGNTIVLGMPGAEARAGLPSPSGAAPGRSRPAARRTVED
jgi:hypothetical protein